MLLDVLHKDMFDLSDTTRYETVLFAWCLTRLTLNRSVLAGTPRAALRGGSAERAQQGRVARGT